MAFRFEWIRRGKRSCHCMRGSLGHGPYWYEYWREGNRTRKRYRRRKRPSQRDFQADEQRERAAGGRTYERARMAHSEDMGLLGLSEGFRSIDLRRAFKAAVLRHHPDRGGDVEMMKRVRSATSAWVDAPELERHVTA